METASDKSSVATVVLELGRRGKYFLPFTLGKSLIAGLHRYLFLGVSDFIVAV